MARRHWKVPHSQIERWYGLGTISGTLAGWDHFGHSGGFPGFITRTATIPAHDITISVLTNAADGWSHQWLDGTMHILRRFHQNGAPARKTADWTGRWWSLWGCFDLVPMGEKVMVATPGLFDPFMDASEITLGGRDKGRVTEAGGFASFGEEVRLVRKRGRVAEVYATGSRLKPEAEAIREIKGRYE